MRGLLVVLLLLLGFSGAAEAQPSGCPFNASSCLSKATGSTTARMLAARSADVLNVRDYGVKGNGVYVSNGGVLAAASTAFTATTATFTQADVGKQLMLKNAVSSGAGVLQKTISAVIDANSVTLSGTGDVSTANVFLLSSAAVASAGTGYAPGDTITAAGGTFTTASVIPVATTTLISATVNAGGSGGVNGTCSTLTDTSGDVAQAGGSHAVFSGTISGGALTGALTVISGGAYNGNPLATAEVITGCSLVAAKVNTVMGALTMGTPSTVGSYTVKPGTFTQGSTSGSGTGATLTPTFFGAGEAFMYGSDDSAGFTAATAAVGTGGARMVVPQGIYLTSLPIFLPSNTTLDCARGAAQIIAETNSQNGNGLSQSQPPAWPLVVNQNWDAAILTDSNISVTGCGFDYRWLGHGGGTHAIRIIQASHIRVDHVTCNYGNDCTAFKADYDTEVTDSVAINMNNACWDHWFHPQYGVVRNNWCSTTQDGILYNSTSGYDAAASVGGIIDGNTIVGTPTVGIWVGSIDGLAIGGGSTGTVISNNTIDGGLGTGSCIKVVGAGKYNVIKNNTCRNALLTSGAILDINDSTGTPTGTIIEGNSTINWTTATNSSLFWSAGTNTIIRDNRTDNSTFWAALRINGSGAKSLNNIWTSGTAGVYFLTGATGFTLRDFGQSAPQAASPCGSSPSYQTSSTDTRGTINVGSGTVTACTFSWRNTRGSVPVCTVSSDVSGADPYVSAVSVSAVTFSTIASVGSGHLYYYCDTIP